MAYATVDDIGARLGRSITDPLEQAQIQAYLDDVSALVGRYCTKGVPDPVPGDVKAVVCSEVLAALGTSPGVISEQDGDVRVAYSFSAGTGSLSNQAKSGLKAYRKQFTTVQIVRDQCRDPEQNC